MLYIASAQSPTPVLKSLLVSDLTSTGSRSLVVAKPDRIEVWDLSLTGLVYRTELQIWGSVISIEATSVQGSRPHILVLQAPPTAHLILLMFDATTTSLIVASACPLNPPTPTLRRAEFYQGIVVSGTTVFISLWIGVLSFIELEVEKDKELKRRRSSVVAPTDTVPEKHLRISQSTNINVREQSLLSLALQPGPSTSPILSVLSLTPDNTLQLQFRSFSSKTHTFVDFAKPIDVVSPGSSDAAAYDDDTDYSAVPYSCPGARHVVPIPTDGDERMVLIIGDEYSVLYSLASHKFRRLSTSPTTSPRASAINRSPQTEVKQLGKKRKNSTADAKERYSASPVWRISQGFGTVLAASVISSSVSGGSVLLSDDTGRLTTLVWDLEHDPEGARSVRVGRVDMGTASPASSLTHLGGTHLFLASSCGDSLLLNLTLPPPPSPSSPVRRNSRKGKGRVSDSSSSITVDEASTGSVAIMERWMNLAPVKDFCAIGDRDATSHLVLASGASSANSLRAVRSGAGLSQVVSIEGLVGIERMWSLSSQGLSSLLISTATSTSLLHISSDITLGELADSIASKPTLVAGLVLDTSTLIQVTAAGIALWSDVTTGIQVGNWPAPAEIVAGHIHDRIVVATRGGQVHVLTTTLDPISSFTVESEISSLASNDLYLAVGTWANEILLYTFSDLSSPYHIIRESSVPSSLLWGPRHLLAGLSDGSLITYDIFKSSVTGRKASSLGTQPLNLQPISGASAGEEIPMAISLSERMSIVFESHGRIDFSSVNLENVLAAASVVMPELGQCLALATPDGLSFSVVDGLKKLHVQTLDLGTRSVNKVAYISEHKILACGAVERSIDQETGDFWQEGFLELRDSSSMQLLFSGPLEKLEEITCITALELVGQQYVAVGSAIHIDDIELYEIYNETVSQAKEGRLRLFTPTFDNDKWSLKHVTWHKTVGAVRDIAMIHEYVATASGSQVSLFQFDGSLDQVSHYRSLFLAQTLYTLALSGVNKLIVGDGMRSVLVLDVDESTGNMSNEDRDMATHSVLAMGGIADRGQGVIVADGSSNILTFRLNESVSSAAAFGLHEPVVRFQPGSFAPRTSAAETIAPDLIFVTQDGRLGMIGELTDSATKILDGLQRNMDKYQKGPGGITWKAFRRGGTALVQRDTAGFIDGDFVQKFQDLARIGAQTSDKILKGSNVHEQITMVDEAGQEAAASREDVARVLEATAGLH